MVIGLIYIGIMWVVCLIFHEMVQLTYVKYTKVGHILNNISND